MEMHRNKTSLLKIGKVVLEAASSDGVAIISIFNPPFNLLSVEVLLNLKDCIEEALLREDVKAVVITGSEGRFSAGFQITSFGGSQKKKTRSELGFFSLEFFTDILEASSKPMVAAIEGPAFGGGLEIALACHARLSTSSAQLGLTELEYGIIPGLGGTQRLPRLVGIHKAIEMIIMSKRVNGEEALSLGLVDAIAPADKLLESAKRWALNMLEGQRPWVASLYRTDKLDTLAEARLVFRSAKIQIQKRTPHVTHPLDCIDVMEEGIVYGPRNGLWKEVEVLEELRQSKTCRSLVHTFFAQRRTSKIPGVSDLGLLPRKINKVALVVDGLEGSGIATMLILSKIEVIMKEVKDSQSDGIHRVKANLQRYVNECKITHEKQDEAFSLLKCVESYNSFKDVDLVIEATTRSLEIKQQIFADLEMYCSQCCVFSSSNSLIKFRLIGEKTKSQNRLIGVNFFSPVPGTRMLELVCTDKAHPQVIIDMIAFTRKIGKTPVVVRGSSGFVMNRMFFLYVHAAKYLAEHGADIYQIDQALIKFGMQLGPLRMIDLIGKRATNAVATHYMELFLEKSSKSKLIQAVNGEMHEGKSGQMTYTSPGPKEMYEETISDSTIDSKLKRVNDGDIVEMILLPVVNEACRIIAEGIVFRTSDIDVASVIGLGFPASRGGIVFWAESLGSRHICSRLESWSNDFGEFFKPCTYLVHQASQGTSLVSLIKQPKSQL